MLCSRVGPVLDMSEFSSVGVRREAPSAPRPQATPSGPVPSVGRADAPSSSPGTPVSPGTGSKGRPGAAPSGSSGRSMVGGSRDGAGADAPGSGPGSGGGRPTLPRLNPRAHTSFHLMAVVRHIGGGEGGHFVTYRRGPVPVGHGVDGGTGAAPGEGGDGDRSRAGSSAAVHGACCDRPVLGSAQHPTRLSFRAFSAPSLRLLCACSAPALCLALRLTTLMASLSLPPPPPRYVCERGCAGP